MIGCSHALLAGAVADIRNRVGGLQTRRLMTNLTGLASDERDGLARAEFALHREPASGVQTRSEQLVGLARGHFFQ